ncbi:MAG TPA: tRNA pseudouridine(55) synthase TruB [Gammaproteobacteria bacterium]|nr:tRNA pseudouridine(55) synthase TruB [Gammaproteobacteria bacterium]
MNIDGILLVNKPTSVSSSQVVIQIKKHFNLKKIGHSGTLDPLATGLLVMGVGEGTKLLDTLLNADKSYHTVAKLGVKTDTYDIDGQVIATHSNIPTYHTKELNALIQTYSGKQSQTPPTFSALKHQGKPLYHYARKGTPISPKPREINIHELTINQPSSDLLEMNVSCSKGTYIRSLVHDIGETLEVGACIQSLKRTKLAHFNLEDAYNLEQLLAMKPESLGSSLEPLEKLFPNSSQFNLSNQEAKKLFYGQALDFVQTSPNPLLLYYHKSLVGVAHYTNSRWSITKRLSMQQLEEEII